MRSLALLLTLLFCLEVRAEAQVLATKALFGGKLSILMPGDFQPMTQELLKRKYPNANPPSIVYSDERAVINVAFEHTPHRVTPEQLPRGLEELKKAYTNAYPTPSGFVASSRRSMDGSSCCSTYVRRAPPTTSAISWCAHRWRIVC
jgi:hypothetical protein